MIDLEVYDDATQFAPAVSAFLERDEAAHSLLLGIVGRAMAAPDRGASLYMALAREGGRVSAVALRTPGRPLVLSLGWSEQALGRLARDARGRLGDLPGVLGPSESASALAAAWRTSAAARVGLYKRERIYALERVEAVRRPPGGMRLAAESDRAALVPWIEAFTLETTGSADPQGSRRMVLERAPGSDDAGLCLWKVGSRPVSCAGYSGPTPGGIRVAPVYTPPEERGRGYATALVADLSSHLLATGRRRLFLFTDLGNPTSNHIYQTIGYRPVIDLEEYRFGPDAPSER